MIKIVFFVLVAIVFLGFVIPLYHERHLYLNAFLTDHTVCYGISYTSAPPFSQCSSQTTDCFTTATGGTVCTHTDFAAIIGFAGISIVVGCFMLLSSIMITYPVAKRLEWL